VLLALGLGFLASTGKVLSILGSPVGLVALCFGLWNAYCAVPYISGLGTNVFRDSAIWGYSMFAWIVAASLICNPELLQWVVSQYAKFAPVYAFAGPAAWAATAYLSNVLPSWNNTYVTIPYLKTGDLCVHLAGVCGFCFCVVRGRAAWLVALAPFAVALGAISRGGGAAVLAGIFVAVVLKPSIKRLSRLLLIAVIAGACFLSIDFVLDIPINGRTVSLESVYRAGLSLFTQTNDVMYDRTTQWRQRWWAKIVNDTVYGPYFWNGRGYGINLAADDGIAPDTELGLRSPHNSHLTFLARAGVPGEVIWAVLQATWCVKLLLAYLKARRHKQPDWAGLFAWVLAYWSAFTVNMTFDVSLEGPMIGIPYWALFGFGWGAQMLYLRQFRRGGAFKGEQEEESSEALVSKET
jgi:hypothetical protein